MSFLLESIWASLVLIIQVDPEVYQTVWTSLYTSSTAIVLAAMIGVPAGVTIALGAFPGRRLVIPLLNTLMALPTVVAGLLVYGFLSRQAPLAPWDCSLRRSP